MNIEHKLLPQWTIACRDLTEAVELKHVLSDFTRGTYELYLIKNGKKITIKYGMTADEAGQGERIYRQIWRFPGWSNVPSDNASGNDLDDTVDKLMLEFPDLTKNDIYVHVWDMSDLTPLNRVRPGYEPETLEGQFILEHVELYGLAPIGNKREQSRVERGSPARLKKSIAPDSLLDRLFE
jgi:hypothetical protein